MKFLLLFLAFALPSLVQLCLAFLILLLLLTTDVRPRLHSNSSDFSCCCCCIIHNLHYDRKLINNQDPIFLLQLFPYTFLFNLVLVKDKFHGKAICVQNLWTMSLVLTFVLVRNLFLEDFSWYFNEGRNSFQIHIHVYV